MIWRVFLTVVGCLEIKMQHLQTNVGRLQTILGNVGGWYYLCSVIMDKWEDDCEVDAGIYEVGLHDMGYFLTFAADYRRNYSGKAAKNVKLL